MQDEKWLVLIHPGHITESVNHAGGTDHLQQSVSHEVATINDSRNVIGVECRNLPKVENKHSVMKASARLNVRQGCMHGAVFRQGGADQHQGRAFAGSGQNRARQGGYGGAEHALIW